VSPVDAALLRRKLGHIAECLQALRPLAGLSLAEYRARLYERKAAERLLQEAIEAALDVNAHLAAELAAQVPDDYYRGFVTLGELGVLPRDLAERLAPSAGLRNRLVHEYDILDDGRVLASIGRVLDEYPRYVQAIEAYLSGAGL
jgi:uncharacterized protein YutE (UPF0331/DUF86 family)